MKRSYQLTCLLFLALLFIIAVPVSAVGLDAITSITPAAGQTGKTVTVTIIGANFTTTTGSVRLEKSGESDIDATSVTWSSAGTEITCKFKISSSRETGKWNLIVVKGYDSTEIEKTNAFTITDPMTLTSITPKTAKADDDNVDFTLAGTNLDDVEDVFLFNKDYKNNITADDIDVASSTKVKGTFDLTDADADTYDVCVEDSYGAIECDLSFVITTNEVGSIDFSSSPSGASIIVDGTPKGTTPDIVDDLIVGSHKVVLKMTGYEEWGKMVTVEADETYVIEATLYPVATATTRQPTYNIPTTVPTKAKTTVKSTIKIPTTWANIPTTAAASPLEPAVVIGAAGIGIGLALTRRR
jgi:hypothetical protein